MTSMEKQAESPWVCAKCGIGLHERKTQVHYLGSVFTVDVLKCPKCGIVLITEEMAVGKMAEAEQLLEDK